MTLIGRRAWYVGGYLAHGTIKSVTDNMAVLREDDGHELTVFVSSLLLNPEQALKAIDEALTYWAVRQAEMAVLAEKAQR